MRTLHAACLLALLAADAGAPAVAGPPRGVMDTTLQARALRLSDWIVANSDLQPLDHLPAFLFVSPEELQYLAFHGSAHGYREDQPIYGVAIEDVVFLPEGFALPRDESTLLHELVHVHQFAEGRAYPCLAAAEKLAYDLQFAFEAGQGRKADHDSVVLASITTC